MFEGTSLGWIKQRHVVILMCVCLLLAALSLVFRDGITTTVTVSNAVVEQNPFIFSGLYVTKKEFSTHTVKQYWTVTSEWPEPGCPEKLDLMEAQLVKCNYWQEKPPP